jgi:hypothetical protein
MFFCIETKVPLNAAMPQGPRSHHLGVKQGMLRQQAMEVPAVPVSPVHHGRNGKAPRAQVVERGLIHTLMIINL